MRKNIRYIILFLCCYSALAIKVIATPLVDTEGNYKEGKGDAGPLTTKPTLPRAERIAPEDLKAVLEQLYRKQAIAAMPASKRVRQFQEFEGFSSSFEEVRDVVNADLYEEMYVADSMLAERSHAHSLLEFVEQQDRFVDILSEETIVDLPVGIKKQIGNLQYVILIDSMVMTPTHAYLVAYMSFTIPQNGKKIAFKGTNIRFSRKGGIQGDARLELLGDHPLNKDAKTLLILKGDGSTFVEWDCYGFKEMGIGAEIEFSRELLIPDTESGEPGADRVKGRFTTEINDWNNLIAEVNMDPFQVKGLKGVGFTVQRAVFDYSSLRNANGIKFPKGYENPLIAPGDSALWEGFYLQELSIRLPKEFKSKTRSARTEFAGYDLIIDNMGFTGTVIGKDLIQRKDGEMGKWAFSLDSLYVNVMANQISSGGFKGSIVVPVDEKTPLNYSAIINPGNKEYVFSITPAKKMEFNIWQAGEVKLDKTSYLEVKVKNGKFLPKAVLHGEMSIAAGTGDGGPKASLAGLKFQGLELATQGQRIKIGAVSFAGPEGNSFGKFPLTINKVGAVTEPGKLGLKLGIALNLMESSKEGFSANGDFIVWGKVDTTSSDEKWSYERLEISALGVDVVKPDVYELHGKVVFFRGDTTYGDGFKGTLDAKFSKIGVKAIALFGNVEGTRYWYADALATWNAGIVFAPGFSFYGFGGGVYHHMKQKTKNDKKGSDIGRGTSGVIYIPDNDTHLGLKAMVQVGASAKKETFNGDATFEVNLNKHGGINQVNFVGNIYVMTGKVDVNSDEIKSRAEAMADLDGPIPPDVDKAQVAGSIHLLYDNQNKSLHGESNIFVNAAEGLVKGSGPANRAGWAVMHFEEGVWYVHIGSPTDQIGLELMNNFKVGSYFMIGDSIPASPPPPVEVSEILGNIDLDYMADLNALGPGQGLAFGVHFSAATGEKKFLMFYGSFKAGLGMDAMVKNYGEDARCEGRSGPIGINGWYANGQAYGYFQGKIGIEVDLTFYNGKYDILDIGAAAVLQAKGPSPFWMRGIVGGRYNILNGLVKGNCKFEVTLGEECKIVTDNPLGGIQIIAEVTPSDGETEVNVFNAPQAVFNMPVDKEFEIKTDIGVRAFRIKLDHFEVLYDQRKIAGQHEWNTEHNVLAFNSHDIFPSEKSLRTRVQVSFEERKGERWQAVYANGKKVTEILETNFTTGQAPDFIPENNVAYSYPIINQYNFYKDEYSKGYIKLKKGQPELFQIGNEWKQIGRFVTQGAKGTDFDITYDAGDKQVKFNFPSDLKNNTVYALEIVNVPANQAKAVDSNVDTLVTAVNFQNAPDNMELNIRTQKAEGSLEILQEKQLFAMNLRTSNYNTFETKFNAMYRDKGWIKSVYPGVELLGSTYGTIELFEDFEIKGSTNFSKLVQFEAVLGGTKWYDEYLDPIIYRDYPIDNKIFLTNRDTTELGLLPLRGIYLEQEVTSVRLDETMLNGSLSSSGGTKYGAILYNLPHWVMQDYTNLRNHVATYFANEKVLSARMKKLLESRYPMINYGTYDVQVRYVLPGNIQTSSFNITLRNPFKDN